MEVVSIGLMLPGKMAELSWRERLSEVSVFLMFRKLKKYGS